MKIFVNTIRPMFSCRVKVVLIMVLVVSFTLPVYAQEKLWKELTDKAILLYQQGQYSEALSVAEEALKVAEETFGPDHSRTAASLNNLAEVYRAQGKYAEAEPHYKRALKIVENVLGKDHPYVAISLNNLAELYRAQGRYSKAKPLYKRALKIQEKALGPDHPDVATVLENMAALYKKIGKKKKAEKFAKRAKKIRSKYQTLRPGQVGHGGSGILFPESVHGFARGQIRIYDSAGLDVSAGYDSVDPQNPVSITVYVYPAPKLVSIGSPPDVVATARRKLTDNHFEGIKHQILTVQPSASLLSEQEAALPFRSSSLYGRSAKFKLRGPFAYRTQPLITYTEVFAFGKWLIKLRMTHPIASETEAKKVIDGFKQAFCEANEAPNKPDPGDG